MRERRMLPVRKLRFPLVWLALAILSVPAVCQSPASGPEAASQELSAAIQDLRTQVQELRATVAEMKSEAAEYRTQSDELSKQLENMRANAVTPSAQGDEAHLGSSRQQSNQPKVGSARRNNAAAAE